MRPIALLIATALVAGCTGGPGDAPTGTSAGASAAPTSATSAAATPAPSAVTPIGAGLEGPTGLTVTVFATGLANVSAFAFDSQGRLWAATAAYDDTDTDAVYRIDAPAARPIKVIASQHTPLGLVWSDETLYVASAGRVDAYTGLAGDAFAQHTTILTLPAGVGEVNGLVMSRDGRLFMGVSAPCDACIPTTGDAAAVISFLPDGSDVQVVANGIRAPVGLAYYPGTDDLFVSMNQRDDLGDATPGDWLSVVRSGQDWGFPDCYGQGGASCDHAPGPVAVLDPHAAVSGVTFVTGSLAGAADRSALVAEWATGKVLRVVLANDGTTYTGTVEPFLTGLSKPVPLITAADGSVLVGDWGTGTIYRIAADNRS